MRFQPGSASYESTAKPSGTVSTIFVVVAPSFSVGHGQRELLQDLRLRDRRAT